MPQSYSPVYFPPDWSTVSMGASNIAVDSCNDNATAEVTIHPSLDPTTLTNASAVISQSNYRFRSHNASSWHGIRTNIGISGTDKVYWEVICGEDDSNNWAIGVGATSTTLSNSPGTAGDYSFIQPGTGGGEKYDGTSIGALFGDGTGTPGTNNENPVGTVWGFAVDYANQDLYMSKNGSWWNGSDFNSSPTAPGTIWDATLSNSVTLFPIVQGYNQGETMIMQFSSDQWAHDVPSGYTALTNTMTVFGNHWTLNPLASTDTLSNGNLSFTGAGNFSSYVTAPAIPISGKWYYEVTAIGGDAKIGTSASYDAYLGLVRTDVAIPTGSHDSNNNLWVIANWNPTPSGQKENGGSAGGSYAPTSGFGDGSIIMVAIDMDNNAMWFGNDGTWAGSATKSEIEAGTTTNAAFTNSSNNSFGSNQMMPYQANHSDKATYNFGAKPFAYSPPTGFSALNTANLTKPTVTKPSNHFKAIIYEGTGAELSTGDTGVEALDFQPDWVWIKNRDADDSHMLYDSVRGETKDLHTNTADTESTTAQTLKSFDANGFTLGTDVQVNTLNESYVAFCLEAGTSWSESSFGSNGLASSGKKSSTHNFSIVSWTHRTSANYAIKHNLGTTPEFFITKSLGQGLNWSSWHKDFADTAKRNWINDSVAESTSYWADASDSADGTGAYADISSGESPVTSTLFALQDGEATGAHAAIAYFFARTPGLIGIGHYIGNDSTDGPYVVADDGASGFKPAWVMIKRVDSTGEWNISDNVRDPDNPVRLIVQANSNAVEWNATTRDVDWLANGFKIRSAHVDFNADNGRYIYLAFAEAPFGGSGIVQARAR
tara:strand:+ start:1335 stop:3818 length:2484 start_codon:yes stop_codon:yes gene_type:complete